MDVMVKHNHELSKENDVLRDALKKVGRENEALKTERLKWEETLRDYEGINDKVSRLLGLAKKKGKVGTGKKSAKKKDERIVMRLKTPRKL